MTCRRVPWVHPTCTCGALLQLGVDHGDDELGNPLCPTCSGCGCEPNERNERVTVPTDTPSTDGAPEPEEVVVDLMQALQDSITAARPEPDLVGRIDKILASGLVLQEGPRGLLFAARDELAESRTRIAALEAVRSKVIEDLNDARIADSDARQYALEDLMTLTKEDPHD